MTTTFTSPWLKISEAAEYLRIAPETLYSMTCRWPNTPAKCPPSYGTGRARRFNVAELDQWQRNRGNGGAK
jgi:hypothetical protein